MELDKKNHWETIYESKNPDEVSWTQEIPQTSLDFIHSFALQKSTKIIDIGGGDSKLVDYLLDEGFQDITVLDISAKALEKAKKRLGKKAVNVKWIVSEITEFKPQTTYDVWHDRATFHFSTKTEQIDKYISIARKAVSGFLIVGTFSEDGPKKCSGLKIRQYNIEKLTSTFNNGFAEMGCRTTVHKTPFGTAQNFIFCSFKKK
jgi:uncharacterized UPF0146 family protein